MSRRKIRKKPNQGKIATAEDLERLSNDPNFVAAVKEVHRQMVEDEATTITVTLAPGMYERIQRHLIDTFADCESVETYITDALDEVLNRFMNDPLTEGFEYDG